VAAKGGGILLRAGIGLGVLLAVIGVLYRYGITIPQTRRAAEQSAEAAAKRAQTQAGRQAVQGYQVPETREAARANAQSALKACLAQAQVAYSSSWNNMCVALAQSNAAELVTCREQGRGDSYCRALYEDTSAKDCALPHATANSIAGAEQAAKHDCYEQYQSAMQ
jgi:hypothetical protein